MKKGLGREIGQFAIFACIIAGALAVLWLASQLGWVLAWFASNWLAFVIGFATAMAMKLVASAFFNRSRDYRRDEE